jgi:hypothetical protein
MDLFMLHTNFQLLIRILVTILLHAASPRLAHYSTFMRSALLCDFWNEKICCSGKLLYESNLFNLFYAFQSLTRRYNLSIKSVSARAEQSHKKCILLSGSQHFGQMMAIALASILSSRVQPKQRQMISIQTFLAHYVHS